MAHSLSIVTSRKLDDAGEWVSVDTYFVDGVEVTKAEADAAFPDKQLGGEIGTGNHRGWVNPKLFGLAVLPKQVAEANEHMRKRGVQGRYDPTGKFHTTSESDRRKAAKARGMRDNDAYYF